MPPKKESHLQKSKNGRRRRWRTPADFRISILKKNLKRQINAESLNPSCFLENLRNHLMQHQEAITEDVKSIVCEHVQLYCEFDLRLFGIKLPAHLFPSHYSPSSLIWYYEFENLCRTADKQAGEREKHSSQSQLQDGVAADKLPEGQETHSTQPQLEQDGRVAADRHPEGQETRVSKPQQDDLTADKHSEEQETHVGQSQLEQVDLADEPPEDRETRTSQSQLEQHDPAADKHLQEPEVEVPNTNVELINNVIDTLLFVSRPDNPSLLENSQYLKSRERLLKFSANHFRVPWEKINAWYF